MTKIIGREPAIKKLQDALKSGKAELIAIYGRRRVGKTFLVRQTCRDAIQFEITGLYNGALADQLQNFHYSLSARGITLPQPANWLEAFNQLEQYIDGLASKEKKVIFIDEFPWLATRRSKFLMAFERFWSQKNRPGGGDLRICRFLHGEKNNQE